MSHESDASTPFRAESWGSASEGGNPTRPRRGDCEQCGSRPLGDFSLCRECYERLPESLCTPHILDELGREG